MLNNKKLAGDFTNYIIQHLVSLGYKFDEPIDWIGLQSEIEDWLTNNLIRPEEAQP